METCLMEGSILHAALMGLFTEEKPIEWKLGIRRGWPRRKSLFTEEKPIEWKLVSKLLLGASLHVSLH